MSAYNETPTTLHDAVCDVLGRLGDKANKAWSRSEIELYLRDGYDLFCRNTKCLFDMHVIPNRPVTGNWQTDFERYIGETTEGFGLTDERLAYTADHERNMETTDDGAYINTGSVVQPTPATSPSEAQAGYFDDTNLQGTALKSNLRGGTMPQTTVEVLRVSFNRRTLRATSSQHLKELDPNYEDRVGDPQWYTWDKDGLFFLRVIPVAEANATYEDVDGSWGHCTQRLSTAAADALPAFENLVSFWRMEETSGTREDSHGSNDLADVNGTTSAAGIQGTLGAHFNQDDNESLGSTNIAAMSITGARTFSVWVKLDSGDATGCVFSKTEGGDGTDEFDLNIDPSLGFPRFSLFTSGGSFTVSATDTNIYDNAWHLITCWYDPNISKIGIQVDDGSDFLSSTVTGTLNSGTAFFSIGKGAAWTGEFPNTTNFDGRMDSFGVWDAVLDSDQRDFLYNSGEGLDYGDMSSSNLSDTIADTGTDGWGFLTFRDDEFPSGGSWGTPTQVHPHALNIEIETYRLGRDLDSHPFEIPRAYLKYVYFYAMAQALERFGPAQNMEMAKHYYERFIMGVERMTRKKNKMSKERLGSLMGAGEVEELNFGLGDPQPPFPYGIPF